MNIAWYCARNLRRPPGYLLAAVLTLSLGITATVAVLAVADAILFNPPAARSEPNLVGLKEKTVESSEATEFLSLPAVAVYRSMNDVFSAVAAFRRETAAGRLVSTMAERVPLVLVSEDYFVMLRATASRGRLFTKDDHVHGGRVVVQGTLGDVLKCKASSPV